MATSVLVSGFDVRELALPRTAEVLLPPLPLPALEDFKDAVARALEEPVDGLPLARRVRPTSRVTVVLDDPSFPVPLASRDARAEMLEAVLDALAQVGVKLPRVAVLVANGLNRQWRPAELSEWLGVRSTSLVAVRCHDAEALDGLVRLADEPEGPIELARQLVECDLLVHLNVVSMPISAGTFGLVQGTAGYRTARMLNAAHHFGPNESPLATGSSWHRAHTRIGALLGSKVPLLQVSAVLNNELWPPGIAALLQADEEGRLTRPLSMWNALPQAVRHRAARAMRAQYRPYAVLAGPPEAVAPRALELYLRQHEVNAQGEADILVFGLPDIGPYAVRTMQNPVLVANLALGLVSNLYTAKPLLRDGGAIVVANPLTPSFDPKVHRAHAELYERVLRLEREPEAIHERYEAYLASRPEFVADYQQRYAFHGAHALLAWYQCTAARRRASRIIFAYGDPRACARLGFMPATGLEDALRKAGEAVADAEARVRVLELPPPFVTRVQ